MDDRTFARRVYLDLIGLIPAPEQLETFLANPSPDKRAQLVKALLADREDYADQWLTFWNDLLRNDYRGAGFIDGGRKQISGWLRAPWRRTSPTTNSWPSSSIRTRRAKASPAASSGAGM